MDDYLTKQITHVLLSDEVSRRLQTTKQAQAKLAAEAPKPASQDARTAAAHALYVAGHINEAQQEKVAVGLQDHATALLLLEKVAARTARADDIGKEVDVKNDPRPRGSIDGPVASYDETAAGRRFRERLQTGAR